ncbi:MAG: L,D-transpeptidase family protein [Ignavibacteriales bacterium]
MGVKSCLALFLIASTVTLLFLSLVPPAPLKPAAHTSLQFGPGGANEGGAGGGGAVVTHDALFRDLPDGCVEWRVLREETPPLKGEDVRDLQEYLKSLGYYAGAADGVYGKATADGVRLLQQALRVPVTGVYDVQTWVEVEGGSAAGQAVAPAPAGKVHLTINLHECRLTVYSDGAVHKSYVVAIGKSETPSPVGEFKVIWKSSGWGGGFGSRWLGLNVPWGTYGIHGTNRPWTIGYMASHGCFRMFNHDVEELFPWVEVGTPVIIEGDLSYVECRNVLRRGSAAQDVVVFQRKLREKGFYDQQADGDFGPATESAVKDMQLHYGLEPNGVTSPDLMRLLGL